VDQIISNLGKVSDMLYSFKTERLKDNINRKLKPDFQNFSQAKCLVA